MSAKATPLRSADYAATIIAGWLKPLDAWPNAAIASIRQHGSVVRIVVASVRGSAPREAGVCMLVERDQTFGTIGGGRLEWVAIEAARKLLDARNSPAAQIDRLVLGTELAQCCGGVVELWIERFNRVDLRMLEGVAQAMRRGAGRLSATLNNGRVTRRLSLEPSSFHPRAQLSHTRDAQVFTERLDQSQVELWLYGAGHVGQALVRVFAELPVRVTWIDSRIELLPTQLPANVSVLNTDDPCNTVRTAPRQTHFLVMTHSHPLDYALCRAILERGDQAWAGVIGSKSKAARFRSRLASDGLPPEQIARLQCPIGIDGIDSKAPGVIAIAVAAQLLQILDSRKTVKQLPAAARHLACRGTCQACEQSQRDV